METALDNPKQFMLAGNATFTIRNEATGNRFTFKVTRAKDQATGQLSLPARYFVKILNGTDNESNYAYMGVLEDDGAFRTTAKSAIKVDDQRMKAWTWFLTHINNLPEQVKVYHAGRCGRCGRLLTVPESIKSGYGPECIDKIMGGY